MNLDDMIPDRLNVARLAVRREAHHLVLARVNLEAGVVGERRIEHPERVRKLLVHKREIRRLVGKTQERGLTLIPLKLYFNRGKVKVEMALARGKRQYDKREDMKRRDAEREIERAFKGQLRN